MLGGKKNYLRGKSFFLKKKGCLEFFERDLNPVDTDGNRILFHPLEWMQE